MGLEEKTLQISGMTCTACASRVEKEINKIEGVEKANVNFPLEQLTVEYDAKETNVLEFKTKVEKNGYQIVEDKVEFDVLGMTCANCAQTVEKGISEMDGVFNANVNLALEKIGRASCREIVLI